MQWCVVKDGKLLKSFYPKMELITCIAHALHKLYKEIRLQFFKIDKMISNIIKIYKFKKKYIFLLYMQNK